MRVVSVTLEVDAADGQIVVPNSIARFLGLELGQDLEARISVEGRTAERTVHLAADGRLRGFDEFSGAALLTLWSPTGREVERETTAPRAPTSLVDFLYALARELDADAQGLLVKELRDAALARGLLRDSSDPYRQVYTALSYAQDRFSRVGRARFRWQEPEPDAAAGLGGRLLLEAALKWCRTHDPANDGVHYQRIVGGLEEDGTPVKGPDPGRTLYSNLIGSAGARTFERVGAGVFRRLLPA